MNAPAITPAQLRRLQTLYSQYERRSLDCPGADRTSRLQWASEAIGREIVSFSKLTLVEAKRLIERLQGVMNVKAPNKSPRRKLGRVQAQKMGTEGRRDQIHDETTLAGPEAFALITRDLDRLGWDQARLDRFLQSPRSPLKGATRISTLAQANKLHWALKRFKPDERKAG